MAAKRKKALLVEVALWMLFAIIAFALTFEFDKDIEIYRFNATGWPRLIIALTVLAALGHLFTGWRDAGSVATIDADETTQGTDERAASSTERLRIASLLFVPLVYAYLLQAVGFYILTPVFIFLILYIAGERRWQYLIGVTLALYFVLLLVFARLLFLNLPIGTSEPFYSISNAFLNFIRIGT